MAGTTKGNGRSVYFPGNLGYYSGLCHISDTGDGIRDHLRNRFWDSRHPYDRAESTGLRPRELLSPGRAHGPNKQRGCLHQSSCCRVDVRYPWIIPACVPRLGSVQRIGSVAAAGNTHTSFTILNAVSAQPAAESAYLVQGWRAVSRSPRSLSEKQYSKRYA